MTAESDGTGFPARWRAAIEAELAEIEAASAATRDDRAPVTLDQQSVGRLARMDAMQVQAMAAATERRRAGRAAGLRAALRRIEAGEFGWCEGCGERIAEARLAIDPTVPLCIVCARGEGR
ncbi:MAG: TraR/DksA family transcriptional regulator [Rubrimonas sp.]